MKENIDQMRERHKKEIETLQLLCNHEWITDWMTEYWAPAHSSGREIKVCMDCGKVVETRGGFGFNKKTKSN